MQVYPHSWSQTQTRFVLQSSFPGTQLLRQGLAALLAASAFLDGHTEAEKKNIINLQ